MDHFCQHCRRKFYIFPVSGSATIKIVCTRCWKENRIEVTAKAGKPLTAM